MIRKVAQNTRPSFSHVRGGSGHETMYNPFLQHQSPFADILKLPEERVLEVIWIKKTNRNSNLDCGLVLNQTWLPYNEHLTFPSFSISCSLLLIIFTQQSSIPVYISLYQSISVYISLYQSCIVYLLIIQLRKSTDRNFLHCCCYAMLS